MSNKRLELEQSYLSIGNELEKLNIQNFKNHCYWRIANDNAVNAKWNTVINKPFYKNVDYNTLLKSVTYLKTMLHDNEVIKVLNSRSLNYRKQ